MTKLKPVARGVRAPSSASDPLVFPRRLVMAAAFLVPVVFTRFGMDAFALPKVTLLLLLTVATAVCVAVIHAPVRRPRSPLVWAGAAFLGAAVVATVFSSYPVASIIGPQTRYTGLAAYTLYAAMAYLVFRLFAGRPSEVRLLGAALVAASAVDASYVLIQAAGLDPLSWSVPTGAPAYPIGTLGDSNFAGAFIAIVLPIACFGLSGLSRELRIAAACVVVLDVAALWFTQTRGGMLAAAAGLVSYWVVRRRWTKTGLLAGAGAFAALAALGGAVLWRPSLLGPLGSLDLFRSNTVTVRAYLWRTAVRMFADRPVAGFGFHGYFSDGTRYRTRAEGLDYGLRVADSPHNLLLQHAVEGGVLLAVAFVVLFAGAVWIGVRRARGTQDPAGRLSAVFVAVIVAYLVQAAFSIDVTPIALTGWLAVGAVAALAHGPPERVEPRVRKRPWLVWMACVAVGVPVVVSGVRPLLGDAALADAERTKTLVTLADGERAYRRAAGLDPWSAGAHNAYGAFLHSRSVAEPDRAERRRILQRSLRRFDESWRRQRNVLPVVNSVAASWELARRVDAAAYDETERRLRFALRLDPTDWEIHAMHGRFLLERARRTDDRSYARAAEDELLFALRARAYPQLWREWAAAVELLGRTDEAEKAREWAAEVQRQMKAHGIEPRR
jgi:O-antigen ligase